MRYDIGKMTTITGLLTVALLMPVTAGIACSNWSQVRPTPELNVQGPAGKVSFEQLIARTGTIIIGRVTNLDVHKETNAVVYTIVTLDVEQTLKGTPVSQVMVRVPGGGDDVPDADTFKFNTGERAVVFLDIGTGVYTVAGGSQGKLTIDNNNNVNGKPLSDFVDQVRDVMARQQQGK
jgi:hypothetical protein